MANDFNEIGRQVANQLKQGKTSFFPLTLESDAFEVSQLLRDQIPVEARRFFQDNEQIEETRQKFGFSKDDYGSLQNVLENQFDGKKFSFYSQGERIFSSKLNVRERASSGAMSEGLNTFLDFEKFGYNSGLDDLLKATDLPKPSNIGKNGLPALKRRFEAGKDLNQDLDDVSTISDFFRAYGIREITIKPYEKVKEKTKETVEKTVKNDDMSQNSKLGIGLIAVPIAVYGLYKVFM
ncbi:MAG: hypothetical protein ACI8Z7_000193 [Candidatus Nanohaloarchaea archaeon]|jgi:hypothetical protein